VIVVFWQMTKAKIAFSVVRLQQAGDETHHLLCSFHESLAQYIWLPVRGVGWGQINADASASLGLRLMCLTLENLQ
jgi:hypothetical protein